MVNTDDDLDGQPPPEALQGMDMEDTTVGMEDEAYQSAKEVPRCDQDTAFTEGLAAHHAQRALHLFVASSKPTTVDTDYEKERILPEALPAVDIQTNPIHVEKEDEAYQYAEEVPRCDNVPKIDPRVPRLRREPKKNLLFTEQDYTRKSAAASEFVTTRKTSSISLPDSNMHVCPECGKTFPLEKALCGHMRCHPNRDYTGIHRPAVAKENENILRTSRPVRQPTRSIRKKVALPKLKVGSRESIFEVEPEGGAIEHSSRVTANVAALDHESDMDSIETLYKAYGDRQPSDSALIWSRLTTEKQSKRSKAGNAVKIVTERAGVPLITPTEDEEVHKAASELMMLSTNSTELDGSQGNGIDGRSSRELELAPVAEGMQEKTHASFDHETKKDGTFQKWKTGKRSKRSLQSATAKAATVPLIIITQAENLKLLNENITFLANIACGLEESEGKLLDGRSPDLELVPEEIQEKASAATEEDELDKQQEGNEKMLNGNKSNNTSKKHVCDSCGRAFETGQALGGHKRRHYQKAVNLVSFPEFPPNMLQQMGATDIMFSNVQLAAAAQHRGGTSGGQGEFFKSKIPHARNSESSKDRKNHSHRRNEEDKLAGEEVFQPAAQFRPPKDPPLDLNLRLGPSPSDDDDRDRKKKRKFLDIV